MGVEGMWNVFLFSLQVAALPSIKCSINGSGFSSTKGRQYREAWGAISPSDSMELIRLSEIASGKHAHKALKRLLALESLPPQSTRVFSSPRSHRRMALAATFPS
ncbi:ORF3 [Fowl aviadenovirus 1]|uniref:Uncharacterized protein ORF3 n=2 Tax=Fowl aviadenovirus A TaxID=190061 RepID=YO3_ADEG1|nr:hypothetical protein FAdVAgp06 [Fowl aviadenovirus A]Q64747.1 RecName: Full=Uncharacterized protein ORF3; Flags: Precursor [Fowl aviadenovirus 1]AAC54900.1 ORF3 [Fowl aviadenovirus 1]QGQ63291.1 ORF3 [Fowl aviadenovirus A]